MRTKFVDYESRRNPKTKRFCCMCQKDIKAGTKARIVHLVNGGMFALHPDEETEYKPDSGDLGASLIGNDCAEKLGLEWSKPE